MSRAPASVTRQAPAKGNSIAWRKWVILFVVVTALVATFTLFDVRVLLRDALDAVARLGAWGPVLFIFAYVVAAVLLVPGSALTLGAGALFGVVWGSVYVSIGATLGATAAFLVGRYVARGWVAKKIEGNAKFAAIDRTVADEGWKVVGLTRLSPVFPFTVLNYAFGLTRVKLRDYVLASWIGMMPGTVMYVYIGSLARAADEKKSPAEWALYGVGLIATIVVTVFITRIARRALAERTKPTPEIMNTASNSPARDTSPNREANPPLQPWDEHNRKLYGNVHPPEWVNPDPAPRYNLVVIGGGTAGLVTAVARPGSAPRWRSSSGTCSAEIA